MSKVSISLPMITFEIKTVFSSTLKFLPRNKESKKIKWEIKPRIKTLISKNAPLMLAIIRASFKKTGFLHIRKQRRRSASR